MNDPTDLRIRRAIAEVLDATPVVPSFDSVMRREVPARMISPAPPRRTGLYVALAAAAAILLAVVAWPRSGSDDAVTTDSTDTTSDSERDTTVTTAASTTSAPNTTTTAVDTTIAPTTTLPEPTATFPEFVVPKLGAVTTAGGPLEFAELPEGWVRSYAGEDAPGDVATSFGASTVGWSAYLEPLRAMSLYTYRSIQLSVERLLPGDLVQEDATAERITLAGREGWISEPVIGRSGEVFEPYVFASALPGDRRLVVAGGEDIAEIESILDGMRQVDLPDGSIEFDLTALADRYVGGGVTGLTAATERLWRTGYSTPTGMFSITVRLRGSGNLVQRSEPAIAVGPWRGFGNEGYLMVFPTPDVSIEFSGGTEPRTLDTLVALAETLVPVNDEEWSRRLAETELASRPPAEPDPCVAPVATVDAVRIDGVAQGLENWTAEPGDTVELDLTVPAGLEFGNASVLVSRRYRPLGQLATVDRLRGSTTIRFTWDGTIDGEQQGPGRYQVSFEAAVTGIERPCDDNQVEVAYPVYADITGAFAIYE